MPVKFNVWSCKILRTDSTNSKSQLENRLPDHYIINNRIYREIIYLGDAVEDSIIHIYMYVCVCVRVLQYTAARDRNYIGEMVQGEFNTTTLFLLSSPSVIVIKYYSIRLRIKTRIAENHLDRTGDKWKYAYRVILMEKIKLVVILHSNNDY